MIEISKIWLTENAVHIISDDGREGIEYFDSYPRLRYASTEDRNNYEIDAIGIHWPTLDEDLSFEGFFKKKNFNKTYEYFMNHPEINVSELAQLLGISQTEMMSRTTTNDAASS